MVNPHPLDAHTGPSHAAKLRMNRVLLCLLDRDESLPVRDIKAALSEPMTRMDCDSAIRRLLGAQQIERVPGSAPAQYRVTPRGRDIGVRLVQRGERY